MDVAALPLAELGAGRPCRQLVVAPTDTQARLIGSEVLRLPLAAFDKKSEATAGVLFTVR